MIYMMVLSALAVVGGTEVDGEYPSVVVVTGGIGVCTATILHERWVLSAAHCWDGVDLSQNPGSPWASLLEADKLPDDYNSAIPLSVDPRGIAFEAVYVHPGYESLGFSPNSVRANPEKTVNDLVLIRVATPLTGPPLALNDTPIDDNWIGIEPRFVGFGTTDLSGGGSGVKRMVDLPIAATDEATIETFRPDASLCQGDSGAPGLLDVDGQLVQLSLATFGWDCERGENARVDAYIDWIQETMGDDLLTIVSIPAPPPAAPDPVSIQPATGCATAPSSLGGLLLVGRRR